MCDECHDTPARFRSQDGPTAADSERFSFGLDLSPEYLDAERKILSRDLCDSCLVTLSQAAHEQFKTVKNRRHFEEPDATPAPVPAENAVTDSPEMPSQSGPEISGNAVTEKAEMPSNPNRKNRKNAVTKNEKMPSQLGQQNQQVTGGSNGSDFMENLFRYEVRYRKTKAGHTVQIINRLRWSDTRYYEQVFTYPDVPLDLKNVADLKAGKFNKRAVEALNAGGLNEEIIRGLEDRPGHGRGKRRTQLDERERVALLVIEQHLSQDAGRRDDPA